MSKRVCYNPIKGVDDVIAAQVPSWNSHYVATLRGMYKEAMDVDTVDVDELRRFRQSLSEKDAKRLSDAVTNPIAAYDQLREAFTTRERVDRVNMVANIFSDVVDMLQDENPGVDRESIIAGYLSESGNFLGGPAFIYKEVYKKLKADMDEAASLGYKEDVEKYRKVFKNWAAIVTYANTVIRDTEGYKTGAGLTFADSTNFSDYNEGSLIDIFVPDESTRESWQEVSDSISPFGSCSVAVRRFLGRLAYVSKDGEDYDDLGYLRRMPVTQMHQSVMELLRGMQSENDMVRIFQENKETRPYASAILDEFKRDPVLRTQFFVDFSKCFQLYSMEKSETKNGVLKFENPILNKLTRKAAYRRYSAALSTQTLDTRNSIFRYNGLRTEVDPSKAYQVADFIERYLGSNDSSKNVFGESGSKFSYQDRKDFLEAVLQSFGIELNAQVYDSIIRNNMDMMALLRTIRELPSILRRAKEGMDYSDLIGITVGANAREGYLREKLGKILQITEGLGDRGKMLSRVRFDGNTYYSDVQSSYLGRFRDRIAALSKRGDMETLRNFINQQYLVDPVFYDRKNHKILNKWLEDLYNSDLTSENSFANMFEYKKMLGDDTQKVDEFTTRKQAVNMINQYMSESKDYAWYPVFVLGDSGASKWIRARKYSSKEILDGYWNVYLQEKALQKGLKELKETLRKEGKSLGSLEKIDDNRYSMLTFLNERKYSDMIDMDNIEQTVKAAVIQYLKDTFKTYLGNMRKAGAFQKTRDGKHYKYLNKLEKYTTRDNVAQSGDEAVNSNLMEYYFNSKFATLMQMQLMSVSPAFYKNGDVTDLQKRYKEIHASGNRLSIDAINPATNKRFSDRAYQNVLYFNDVKANPELTDPKFMEVIANVYGKDSPIYRKYRDETSFTDGQAYRTLESYRAVMGMSGKWNSKCEAAYNEIQEMRAAIRDNGGSVTEDQMKKINSLMVTLQPIKPFYYTLENMFLKDSETGKNIVFHVPVQMKYAEIVVIPELMPKGSRLRDMMEAAEARDIDLVAATSAVKVGSFGSVDVDSATGKKGIEEAFDSAYVHKLGWEDFVIQNNVPEHILESRLFATQSRKIIFSNLRQTDDQGHTVYYDNYTDGKRVMIGDKMERLNAYNLNRFYVSLIATNILEDLDNYTNIMKDPEKVRNVLVQMTLNNSRETKDNLRGYGADMEHDFKMALFEGGIEHDTAALLLSMFKKQVNKQKINGGSAVQASAYGLTGYEENKNLHFVRDPNNPNNILYAECEMAWDLSFTDSDGNKVDLEFSDWCNPDGTLKMLPNGESKLETKFPGITSFIAYRIPTESHYSMLNMKVVRFTPKVNGGGTIKVPAQGTTIAGFDFDIDKLYFMRREYRVKRKDKSNEMVNSLMNRLFGGSTSADVADLFDIHDFESYDYAKNAWDKSQTRAARNNMLITLMQHRLADPQTIRERTTPGGFEHAKEASRYLKRLMGINDSGYDFTDPWTMVTFTQQNQVAGKLIGIFANQNTNTAMASLMKTLSLKQPIAFGNHPGGLSNLLNPGNLVKELLAASVDAVKEPVLNFLNLNTITADSAGMLCRLGYSFEEIGLLMNQPIIKYLCDYCMDNNMLDIDTAINNVLQDWKAQNKDYSNDFSFKLTVSVLEEGIRRYADNPDIRNDKGFVDTQAQVLELFRNVYASAKELSSFVTNTKFTASNAVKSTFGGMYEQQDKVRKYVESLNSEESRLSIKVSDYVDDPVKLGMNISARDSYIMDVLKNPFGYEQVMYDANVQAMKLLGKYYPYGKPTYTSARQFMERLTKSGIDGETIDEIHRCLLMYMAGTDERSVFNPDHPVELPDGDLVNSRDYYTKYVPMRIAEAVRGDDSLKELPIFGLMTFETDDEGNIRMRLGDNGALTPPQKEDVRESWEALLSTPRTREMAYDLYMYSYYTDGFGFGVYGFNHLAPLELKLEMMVDPDTSYTEFLNKVLADEIPVNETAFARQFIMSHRNNSRLVYEPKSKQLELIQKYVYQNNMAVDSFTLDYTGDPQKMRPFVLRASKDLVEFKPALFVDGMLYIADGLNLNQSPSGQMTYRRADRKSSDPVTLADIGHTESQKAESSTSIDGEDIVNLDPMTLEDLADAVVRAWEKSGKYSSEQAQAGYKTLLENIRRTDEADARKQLIDGLVEEYKEQGVHCKLNGELIC